MWNMRGAETRNSGPVHQYRLRGGLSVGIKLVHGHMDPASAAGCAR